MRKFLVILSLASLGIIGKIAAQPRSYYTSQSVFEDNGDSLRGFAVGITSYTAGTNAVLVYSSQTTGVPRNANYKSVDRFLTMQNQTGFDVYCGTFPTVSPTSGPRWVLYSTGTAATSGFSQWGTNTPPVTIYCTMNTVTQVSYTTPIIGWVDYDSGD